MSDEEIALLVHSPLAEFKHRLRNLKSLQIQALLQQLDQLQNSKARQNKAVTVLKHLQDRQHLESYGQGLSVSLAIDCFNNDFDQENIQKLNSVLVGLSHPIFSHLLSSNNNKVEENLKKLSDCESLQHHLTLFSHEMEQETNRFVGELEQIEDHIDRLKPEKVLPQQIAQIFQDIARTLFRYQDVTSKLQRALSIAWNSGRTDLIDSLSTQKENWEKLRTLAIGETFSGNCQPTGLYARLDRHLGVVYADLDNPDDTEGVRDDDPAIEALAKLGAWYLRDYWNLGLLPEIQSLENINEKDRHHLLSTVRHELGKRGLLTVRDLRRQKIYSLSTLKQFLNP
ncbi:MAG: hypothetical protein H7A37_07600 [Chlamydiales bacterium]|nr:hypothetical protein [Chlamydiia bacterium]MCP5508149.1 hypothetical protein [Chlamydiales bacterium]